MAEGTFTFEIDWDNDGDFGDTGEDVSARIRAQSAFQTSHGRRQNRRLSPPAASRARFALINTSGDYYPDNGSSPINGDVVPGRVVHVGVNFDSSDYDLFSGQLFGLDFVPNPFGPFVNVECLDVVNTLNRSNPTVEIATGKRIDELIELILDAVGWPSADRDIDVASDILEVWYADGQRSAWEEILSLLEVEGPPAVAYVGPDGNFVFKSRHHRLLDSRATSSQNTFVGTGTEPTYQSFTFDPGWRDIINRVEIPVTSRKLSNTRTVVWEAPISLPVSSSLNPTLDIVTEQPFPTSTAIATFNEVSGIPNITADFTGTWPNVTVTFDSDTVGVATITEVKVLARVYLENTSQLVTAEDATSQAAYGLRTWRARSSWHTSVAAAQSIADLIIHDRKDPRTIATIEVNNGDDTRYTAGLDTQISDLITVDDAESSVDGDFYIENIGHTVQQGGKFHTVRLGLESAKDPLVAADEVFILDSGTQGVLDTNKLGY